jgi:uncharacterized protein (TIGR04141 family)
MPSLNVFRIRDLDGDVPAIFDRLVEPEELDRCTVFDYADDGFTARLYLPIVRPQPPRWAPFVRAGFPDAPIGLGTANQALIIGSVRRRRRNRIFAVCFGHARHLVRSELIEPGFGRRLALNLLYEAAAAGGEISQSRIRQVDARTIEANVRRARVQRSRDTTFETFGVDPERDLLDRIVGVPRDVDSFGRRISGGDSVHLDLDLAFEELGPLLLRLLAVHERHTYKDHFAWVDRVRVVTRPSTLDRLRQQTVQLILAAADELDLAPPEIVDWDRFATFTFSVGDKSEYTDLRLEDYLSALDTSRVAQLEYRHLQNHRVRVLDGNGVTVGRWPIARALFGAFDVDGLTYVVDDGHYFEVAADYLQELDGFIRVIEKPAIELPPTSREMSEASYNTGVADGGQDRLLLDAKTIRVAAARTTPIEICDIMTSGGELIHVKRKLGSSDLSHLFSQGYVSAETIHASPNFRATIRRKILEAAQAQDKDPAAFSGYVDEPFSPARLTVVYAVAADWKGKAFHQRLPFFSKVNLRHHGQQLRRMGFKLAFAGVDAS